MSLQARAERFGAVLSAWMDELDWARLGNSYCEGDGSTFFDDALRASVLEVGLRLAEDVASELPPRGSKRSVYLGAAVAELAPILAETIVLERDVRWLNLAGDESLELARAAGVVSKSLDVALPVPSAESIESVERASCDHLWIVSVLTDPDEFPALHDELYERKRGPLATKRGDLGEERQRAKGLGEALLARAAPACLLTTTDEELEVLRPLVRAAKFSMRVPGEGRESAIVGDVVRSCRLSARRR